MARLNAVVDFIVSTDSLPKAMAVAVTVRDITKVSFNTIYEMAKKKLKFSIFKAFQRDFTNRWINPF